MSDYQNNNTSMKRPINSIGGKPKKACWDGTGSRNGSSIEEQKKSLTIFKVRRKLLVELDRNRTLILVGETGCGKTTQLPQYLYDSKMDGDGLIGVTQPRRVAAISVATRVAAEMNVEKGGLVGYTVRFEDVTSDQTRIKYLTDGMLLREAMLDKQLSAYSTIILDEAHERTINTDVLFGIVKQAQEIRSSASHCKPLRIIVMSATMDVDHFSRYFNKAPVVYLEGRQFPVEVKHAVEQLDDYLYTCLVTIFQIHKEAPPNHDILVFLTGQEEIESMAQTIRSTIRDPSFHGKPDIKVFPLYAALCSSKQLEVFQPCKANTRKVILSTNIAETSITISGIKFVIDSGMVKQKTHVPSTGLNVLRVNSISQAQAWQRTGRAGRESPGVCYRAYTKSDFDKMPLSTKPEILRTDLSAVLLQLLAMKIDVFSFDFIDKPPSELTLEAVEQLKSLEALKISNKEPELTSLGEQMAVFPLDPKYSKIILSAEKYGCVEEVITIIALLSGESVFVSNVARREKSSAAHAKFASTAGDHITLLNVFRAYNSHNSGSWCYENYLHTKNLDYASKVRKQLIDICQRAGVRVVSCGGDHEKIRKCFVAGFFSNVAELQRDKKYLTMTKKQVVSIHPSSFLAGTFPPLVLFTELVQTKKCYMRYVMPVEREWVDELSPKGLRYFNSDEVD